jgi:hypothetical protein
MEERVGQQFAEFDFQLKLHAHRINEWLTVRFGSEGSHG